MSSLDSERGGGRTAEAHAVAKRALHADVGERIRRVRTELGVGQAECARAAGIDVSSMFRIEKGSQNLTVETLGRLAYALNVPPDRLLSGVLPAPDLVLPRSR